MVIFTVIYVVEVTIMKNQWRLFVELGFFSISVMENHYRALTREVTWSRFCLEKMQEAVSVVKEGRGGDKETKKEITAGVQVKHNNRLD